MKCRCYLALFDTWVGYIAARMRLEELYGQKRLISKNGGRFLFSGKKYPPKARHHDFEYRPEKNLGYFVIVDGLEDGTNWIAS